MSDRIQETEIGKVRGGEPLPETRDEGGERSPKKARVGSGEDLRRVAEIVMVLSAMGKIRGGRDPSEVEKGLMAEARERLAGMCQSLAPKDLLSRDAIRVVMEDLGLNRMKDQRMGFRPPKISISEKLALTKKKMEEPKEIMSQPATYSSQMLHVGLGTNSNGQTMPFHSSGSYRNPLDKPSSLPISTANFQSGSSVIPVSAIASTASLNVTPVKTDMQTQPAIILMNPPPSSSSANEPHSIPLPRTEPAHFILEQTYNGPSYVIQVQASPAGDNLQEKPPTSSSQSSSMVSKVGAANKAADHTPAISGRPQEPNSFQVPTQPITDQNPKTFAVQTAPLQSLAFMHQPSSIYTPHNDIARNVQKILQSRVPEQSKWDPPSFDYMNKPLTCEVCKLLINDIDSLLVCDACDKGVHWKCLTSLKGIPKGEWHCLKCLSMSKGRPLPPKYGRVSRNITTSRVPPIPAGTQASSNKTGDNADQKSMTQPQVVNSGNPALAEKTVSSCNESTQETMTPNCREEQVASMHVKKEEEGARNRIAAIESEEKEVEASAVAVTLKEDDMPPVQANELHSPNTNIFSSTPNTSMEVEVKPFFGSLETVIGKNCASQASHDSQQDDLAQAQSGREISKSGVLEAGNDAPKLHGQSIMHTERNFEVPQREEGAVHLFPEGRIVSTENATGCIESSAESLCGVEWVGDALKVVDEKTYYRSCCIKGTVFRLRDHVLCSKDLKLVPSKLQVLWEDNATSLKWAIASKCYYPNELPVAVGRPCTPETTEVYESNHDDVIEACLIQGLCQVLPPNKFRDESERRRREPGDWLFPIFLSKWFYDEKKALFRPITD